MSPSTCILVLEDDPLIRPLLERWLGEAGYRVTASVGQDAKPALVIANVADPNSAVAQIQALQAYAAPILVVGCRVEVALRIRHATNTWSFAVAASLAPVAPVWRLCE